MTIKYKATGKERKRLAQTIADILESKLEYKGAPTFAYRAGYCTVDKDSNVIVDDGIDTETQEALFQEIALQGFESESFDRTNSAALEITIPLDEGNEGTYGKVTDIIASKATLFKHAFGINDLCIDGNDTYITFPWFTSDCTPEESIAYQQFFTALVKMAKSQKRIIAKERRVDNEKYAFRCFLLRLGFIGREYKTSRKILLKNLSGSCSFKTEKEAE